MTLYTPHSFKSQVHSRFPITRISSIGDFSASSARGILSICYFLLCAVMRIIWCMQSVCQWCHVNNCMYIVKKRVKKIFASIQHGIDLFDGMYSKYYKYNNIIIKISMLIRCIFEYFQKKRKVVLINVINSNINVKMLLLVFIYK